MAHILFHNNWESFHTNIDSNNKRDNDDLEIFDNPSAYMIASFSLLLLYVLILLILVARKRICRKSIATTEDRQGNVFTIHDENSRESRYNDIFFIEPNSVEAARIRAQLEKDDKDLPSYEEVMRMTSMNPPPPTTTTNTAEMGASNASVNTTETRLSVPPYSEIDPNASSTSLNASSLMATATPSSDSTLPTHSQSAPPPLFAAAVVSSSLTQTTSNV
ncbi:uncharacterized protein LOC142238382 isoform X4 [Haematobia irritans]|uniref:uncharacterized protein LOC142238382 isoform X4 n=1 Tax=Haematobia irritans TaxID=7368 RepID=UPI003F4F7354